MRLKHPGPWRRPRVSAGASLIEALVALTVLAFGVLGLAGLQTRTLLESRATHARAVAVRLAADLGERIRSNPGTGLPEHSGASSPYLMDWGASPAAADCWTVACDPRALARFDLMQWKASLSHLLPGGDARIFASATDPAELGILIAWTRVPQRAPSGGNGTGSLAPDTPLPAAPGITDVACKEGLMCHLVFMRP